MNIGNLFEPLKKEEVINAVEGRHPSRIPLVRAKWWGEGLHGQYGDQLKAMEKYPEDVVQLFMPNPVDPNKMDLSWEWRAEGAHDNRVVIDEWSKLDEFIEKLPDPREDADLQGMIAAAETAQRDGLYTMLSWWGFFFERPWSIRGMANLMTDYYLEPDNIQKLHEAMASTYIAYIEESIRLIRPDAFFTSDDLGHQTGPMMSPEIFHEMLYPYYVKVGEFLRKNSMHFWLHSCGDNSLLLPDLIAAGVDVFHPVQKHTMDEQETEEKFGGKITFLAGIDVQHTLQEKDPEGVRAEVRFIVDTFDRPEGRMCIGAGNGIVAGTPLENIEAFLDEALRYGAKHREDTKKG